ncbi:MAG: sugar ABC transporter permease [Bifidobacteriaceae bacterium]|jgi:sorbitol/mannitol transport system permease protein|nr:sugar ABC transporter permease [Bifidobacteriaceae bacterium]
MPALIFLVVVTQIPFVVTIVMSLFRWNIMYPDQAAFGGFANYVRVIQDPRMRAAILNTSVMVAVGVLASLVLGTALALLLNRRFFGRGVVRTMLITPFLIMPMAASLMWKHLIYNPEYGLVNGVLKWLGQTFGFEAPQPEWVSGQPMAAVIVVLVWTWTPFMMLITLAGLQSQDPEVKEAAMIDGAGPFQQFRFLTFKHLRQYLELSTVLGVIYLLNAYDQVFSITQGGPDTATTNLPYEIYITIFRGYEYGEGAAAGVLVVVFSVVISNFGLRLISSLNDVLPSGGKK